MLCSFASPLKLKWSYWKRDSVLFYGIATSLQLDYTHIDIYIMLYNVIITSKIYTDPSGAPDINISSESSCLVFTLTEEFISYFDLMDTNS